MFQLIAYLMKENALTLSEATEMVSRKRGLITPGPKNLAQVALFQIMGFAFDEVKEILWY